MVNKKLLVSLLLIFSLLVIFSSGAKAACGTDWFCGINQGYTATFNMNAKACDYSNGYYTCVNNGLWAPSGQRECKSNCYTYTDLNGFPHEWCTQISFRDCSVYIPAGSSVTYTSSKTPPAYESRMYNSCVLGDYNQTCTLSQVRITTSCCVCTDTATSCTPGEVTGGGGGPGCTNPAPQTLQVDCANTSGFYGQFSTDRGVWAEAYSCNPIANDPNDRACYDYYTSKWEGFLNVTEEADYEFHVKFNPMLKFQIDLDNDGFEGTCPSFPPSGGATQYLGDKWFYLAYANVASRTSSYRPLWLNDLALDGALWGEAKCSSFTGGTGIGTHIQNGDENTYVGSTCSSASGGSLPVPDKTKGQPGSPECPISANNYSMAFKSGEPTDWSSQGFGHSYFTRHLTLGSKHILIDFSARYGDADFTQSIQISYRKAGGTWMHLSDPGSLPGGVCPITPCLTAPPIPTYDAWWQVKDSDLLANGGISSAVPTGSVLSAAGLGGFPGVSVFGLSGTLNYGLGTLTSKDTTDWNAQTNYSSLKVYDYAFFARQIPQETLDGATPINTPIDSGTLLTGGYQDTRGAGDYFWYKYTGDTDLVISEGINLGDRKVILLVPGKNVSLQGNINVNKGVGFFALFVGHDADGGGGSISVDGAVTELEGIYFADGNFSTDGGLTPATSQLHTRGAVASLGIINMDRVLADNSVPAELWEYGPDQIMLMMANPSIAIRKMSWKEVAP